MKKETIKILGEMMGCASDDVTRVRLSHVFVKRVEHNGIAKLDAFVTNAHVAVKRFIDDAGLLDCLKDGETVAIDTAAIKMMGLSLGKAPMLPIERGEKTLVMGFGELKVTLKIDCETAARNPDKQVSVFFEDVKRSKPVSVSFNAEYLVDLLYAMREAKRQVGVTIKFDASDVNKAISVCVIGGTEARGVLMPMRG